MSRSCSPVTLIAGDGIGPEIVAALVEVFAALGRPVEWEMQAMGLAAFRAGGEALPAATLESIQRTRLALKGPVMTPPGSAGDPGFRSPLVRLREHFDLYANLRPAHTVVRGGPAFERFGALDLVVVRENTEGLYASREWYEARDDEPHGIGYATAHNSAEGCRRIVRFAYQWARQNGRRKVTAVHKANVLRILSGIFRDAAREVYENEFREAFAYEEMIVDACAMKLVAQPEHFDTIVTTNLFGDILSDLTAGLTGGLGLAAGANLGKDCAIFEAVHGAAPDIAGRGVANPVALLNAGAMLLAHIGRTDLAARLAQAIDATLNQDRVHTPDLGGTATTEEITRAIIARL